MMASVQRACGRWFDGRRLRQMGSSQVTFRALALRGLLTFVLISTMWVGVAAGDTFSGYVSDADVGAPIANALVEVGNGTQPTYSARTDANGYYVITGVPTATDYSVMASAVGYASGFVQMKSPGTVDLTVAAAMDGHLVETVYRGKVNYVDDGTWCVRGEGSVSEGPFDNIDAQSTRIDALMVSIGAGTQAPTTPEEKWAKCVALWNWCKSNMRYAPGDATYEAAMDYLMVYGWPSIQRIAETFDAYGFVPWGTCMSRAQLFTTLLYRTGVSRDELGLCETVWKFRYSQHMYTAVWISNRWLYLDPTYNHLAIPAFGSFASVPTDGAVADYCHPISLRVISGSSLHDVPVLTNRTANNEAVFITVPPKGTWSLFCQLTVNGVADPAATEVVVNGASVPVVGGSFSTTVALGCGENTITAEVKLGEDVFVDEIQVGHWCRGDLDWDGDVDWNDFGIFAAHLAGPAEVPDGDPMVVAAADRDDDGDVDIHDYAAFAIECRPE